ncbi:uncharacterized protein F4807DRAFT_329425 [Annulohypoxylon truncatum]|uniref:uncharacterized protein n=1 Tax=Annulohypoxylon truncatum TaxID=327061 RepID=UPI0020072DA9|nr:uncharacterized protein F4807DRAFT_329425 [Annulohypoxylon truncatum]KAI1204549.1 hypothetical protein F4807DRAFT_329425 [Annulohypoxylon truncatum]
MSCMAILLGQVQMLLRALALGHFKHEAHMHTGYSRPLSFLLPLYSIFFSTRYSLVTPLPDPLPTSHFPTARRRPRETCLYPSSPFHSMQTSGAPLVVRGSCSSWFSVLWFMAHFICGISRHGAKK